MENMTKALVVDEDLICLNVASKLFETFNLKVVAFQSAAEALHALKRSKDDEIALALIEVHVGYTGFASMTGFDLLDHIKKEKNIPIFTMCAHKDDDRLLVRSLQGTVASFHISKPLTAERVQFVHQKVMEAKAKSSVGEILGNNDFILNEVSASENITHSDIEGSDGRGQGRKRTSSAAEDIIRKIVLQGQNTNQTSIHLQENQQAKKNNGMMSFQGSASDQLPSRYSYFQPIQFCNNRDSNETTLAPQHATATTILYGPFLSELLNTCNTAPHEVPANPVYPFVGLCMQTNGNLLGLQWKNIGRPSSFHFGEGSGSFKPAPINAIRSTEIIGNATGPGGLTRYMTAPGGNNLAAPNWNNIDYCVAPEGKSNPDALHGNNSGSNVSGGFSGDEPDLTEFTGILDVEDFDRFDTDGSFMNGEF